jgi:hypothetical protein
MMKEVHPDLHDLRRDGAMRIGDHRPRLRDVLEVREDRTAKEVRKDPHS